VSQSTREAAPPLEAAGLLAVQAPSGVRFWPFDEIALIMDECQGRVTVVAADGTVAHRPGPVESAQVGGLARIGPGILASPRLGRVRGGAWELPGGWVFPRPASCESPERTAAPVPIQIDHRAIDLARLRGLEAEGRKTRIALAGGESMVVARSVATRLARRLGLESADNVTAWSDLQQAMFRLELRDFPCVLLEAPAAFLRSAFGADIHACMANLIWEAVRHRQRGTPLDYGTEYRGFWYRPILPVISRLGLREKLDYRLESLLDPVALLGQINDPQYALYGQILDDIVGHSRLATFRDIGFVPSRPDLRALGTKRPQWLLVVEKASLEPEGRQLAAEFGLSMVILGGMARWEAAEPVAEMLAPVAGPVKIVAYGDYDPAGWLIDDVLVEMLARYDIKAEIAGRLVLPGRFTQREIDLLAEPIPMSARARTLSEKWLARTHGIDGRPLGLHADHLRPYERVRRAFVEETGLSS
jgi:hypothetical protein